MADSFKQKHKKKKTSFIRNRVLGFSGLIIAQVSRMVKSLSVELDHILELLGTESSYSKQAFSKSRQNLAPSAFIEMNQHLVKEYYQDPSKLYAGQYKLVAVDGSNLHLYQSKKLHEHFGSSSNSYGSYRPMGKVSLLYDVMDEMVLDAQLSPYGTCERQLFLQHLKHTEQLAILPSEATIYIADRGYPSYELLKELGEKLFVIRCKESHNNSIKKFVKTGKAQGKVDLHEGWGGKGAKISVRIVRTKTKNGYCYLLTNTNLTTRQLGEIYQLRWGVETYYKYLKHSLELENFTAKSVIGVEQDFYSAVFTSNLAQMLINEANEELEIEQERKKGNKYFYKVNKNVAIGILKQELPPLLFTHRTIEQEEFDKLKERIKRYKTEIKPGRSSPRQKENSRKRKKPLYVPNRKRSI